MNDLSVLNSEPRVKITELVAELVGRRDEALALLQPELSKLVIGLVDQFMLLKKHQGIRLSSIRFERSRWVRDGRLVIDLSYDGKPFTPRDAAFD